MSCDSDKNVVGVFSICYFNLCNCKATGNAQKWWTESKRQKGKASKQGSGRRQDETREPEKGKEDVLESREEKASGSERERKGRRMETGREGERCLRGWMRGEEENRKRVIMPQSSLFPVSLD